MRKGICQILSAAPELVVVCETASGEEAVAKAEEHLTDVILLDITLPESVASKQLAKFEKFPLSLAFSSLASTMLSKWSKKLFSQVAAHTCWSRTLDVSCWMPYAPYEAERSIEVKISPFLVKNVTATESASSARQSWFFESLNSRQSDLKKGVPLYVPNLKQI
jgi:DNA-binding NarL/FixJ family response regulator